MRTPKHLQDLHFNGHAKERKKEKRALRVAYRDMQERGLYIDLVMAHAAHVHKPTAECKHLLHWNAVLSTPLVL